MVQFSLVIVCRQSGKEFALHSKERACALLAVFHTSITLLGSFFITSKYVFFSSSETTRIILGRQG